MHLLHRLHWQSGSLPLAVPLYIYMGNYIFPLQYAIKTTISSYIVSKDQEEKVTCEG